jgi:tripartite-type tricarboxylate transporter receptor subunit TctC
MRLISLVGLLTAIATGAFAQDWPSRQPIRVIVSNTAGSGIDIVGRVVFDQMSKQLGQTIVVENRPGAANTIGIGAVAKAEPDGYTVLVTTSAIAIAPHTNKNLSYDTLRDLQAIIPLGNFTNAMLTPAGRFKSLNDLVAAGKAKPDALSYASIGPGSTGHLSAERFTQSAGFKALHIPFKGTPEAMNDLAAGRVDFFYSPAASALGLIRENKIEALAIGSSNRSPSLPNLQTTLEAGFPNSDYDFWMGVFAPSAVPQPIADRLHEELKKALAAPTVRERLDKIGADPMAMTRAEFQARLEKEIADNAALVKAANISAQ